MIYIQIHQLSGSSIGSEDLIIQKNRFSKVTEKQSESPNQIIEPNAGKYI